MENTDRSPAHGPLKRELGVFQAMMLGLGSIIGTGVFISIGIGANVAGDAVLLAIVCAAFLALCNGISSAQLVHYQCIISALFNSNRVLFNANRVHLMQIVHQGGNVFVPGRHPQTRFFF